MCFGETWYPIVLITIDEESSGEEGGQDHVFVGRRGDDKSMREGFFAGLEQGIGLSDISSLEMLDEDDLGLTHRSMSKPIVDLSDTFVVVLIVITESLGVVVFFHLDLDTMSLPELGTIITDIQDIMIGKKSQCCLTLFTNSLSMRVDSGSIEENEGIDYSAALELGEEMV